MVVEYSLLKQRKTIIYIHVSIEINAIKIFKATDNKGHAAELVQTLCSWYLSWLKKHNSQENVSLFILSRWKLKKCRWFQCKPYSFGNGIIHTCTCILCLPTNQRTILRNRKTCTGLVFPIHVCVTEWKYFVIKQ